MNAVIPQRIEKEDLSQFNFSSSEVLSSKDLIQQRNDTLQKACMLGNNYKGKVKIAFSTTQGPKEVYTTIWTVSHGHVSLKNGAHIPVHSIYEVSF